jgi:hypothetical protein
MAPPVDGDKVPLALAGVVKCPRDDFLARTGFAVNQDVDVDGCQGGHPLPRTLDGG